MCGLGPRQLCSKVRKFGTTLSGVPQAFPHDFVFCSLLSIYIPLKTSPPLFPGTAFKTTFAVPLTTGDFICQRLSFPCSLPSTSGPGTTASGNGAWCQWLLDLLFLSRCALGSPHSLVVSSKQICRIRDHHMGPSVPSQRFPPCRVTQSHSGPHCGAHALRHEDLRQSRDAVCFVS